MASSISKMCRNFHLSRQKSFHFARLTTRGLSSLETSASPSENDDISGETLDSSTSFDSKRERIIYDRPLENGLDVGIYRAILVGQVGQKPVQKQLKSGKLITLFSLGTGGIRNNRRPLENEEPRDYANRCSVQWHRVSVYPERLGMIAFKNVEPGSIIYVEGNLETKVFMDSITGLVRRIREIAVRQNGRIVFIGNGMDSQNADTSELRAVGYY